MIKLKRHGIKGMVINMRLIDADALIAKCGNWYVEEGTEEGFISNLKHLIDLQPTIEPEPHWIPCEERLPEDGERVLATHLGGLNPDRQVIEHIYKNGEFTLGWDMDINMDSPTFGQRYMGKVVAWMPLPELYREDGE